MTKQSKAQQTTNQQENKMNKQTEAQRLADWLDNADCNFYDESSMWFDSRLAKRVDQAVAELRRLDALNAELVEALEDAIDSMGRFTSEEGSTDRDFDILDNAIAALAKAKERT